MYPIPAELREAGREHWIIWNWSKLATWMLRLEPGSFGRVAVDPKPLSFSPVLCTIIWALLFDA